MPLHNLFINHNKQKEDKLMPTTNVPENDSQEPVLATKLAEQISKNQTLSDEIKALTARAEKAEATLLELQSETKVNMRKAKLAAVMDEDLIDDMLMSTTGLDDNAFDVIVTAFSAKVTKQESEWEEKGNKETKADPKEYLDAMQSATLKLINAKKGVK